MTEETKKILDEAGNKFADLCLKDSNIAYFETMLNLAYGRGRLDMIIELREKERNKING